MAQAALHGKTIRVVVAKYKEDVDWVEELGFPASIYDKSGACCDFSLPNIGREAHSYLHHILEHYPHFEDYTVFLQGDPFKHLAEGADVEFLRDLIVEKLRKGVQFSGLAWYRLGCDRLGRPHHMRDADKKGRWKGWGKDIPVGEVFEKLFPLPAPEKYVASAAAGLFIVSRERILTRPLSFYENAMDIVLKDPEDEDNTGHAFERLWQIIFNGSKQLNPGQAP
jgi:hypothetical protein